MNFTERLQVILDWIASRGKQLSREGLKAPDHLAGARVYFYEAIDPEEPDKGNPEPCDTYADEKLTIKQTHPIFLGARGQLVAPLNQVWLKPDSKYRVQVHDSDNVILFTEDHIST
jgi:hypothetical protein